MASTTNDPRLLELNKEEKATQAEYDKAYNQAITGSDKLYQQQIDQNKAWGEEQQQLQQKSTDFEIQKIEQQKADAQKSYEAEQAAAYGDYQKATDPYGGNAEVMAAQGMAGSGYAESSKVAMYTAYQNRVATARAAIEAAKVNYNNMMTEARLNNDVAKAELAYKTQAAALELALQGFNAKTSLTFGRLDAKQQIKANYDTRRANVLSQINAENALEEEQRQYNNSLYLSQQAAAQEAAYDEYWKQPSDYTMEAIKARYAKVKGEADSEALAKYIYEQCMNGDIGVGNAVGLLTTYAEGWTIDEETGELKKTK